jgi:hypothetical protein
MPSKQQDIRFRLYFCYIFNPTSRARSSLDVLHVPPGNHQLQQCYYCSLVLNGVQATHLTKGPNQHAR